MDGKGDSNTIFGFGINDVESVTQKEDRSNGKRVVLWRCPYYTTWYSIVRRSYSSVFHRNAPTYRDCTVSEEWRYFSNFKLWMEGQNWQGMQLDKDILFEGNREYSAETCVFITSQVNSFISECGKARGEFPIGVYYKKKNKSLLHSARTLSLVNESILVCSFVPAKPTVLGSQRN